MNQSHRQNHITHIRETVHGIVNAPSTVIPGATDYAVKKIIVDMIELYIRGELSLTIIASVTETIQRFTQANKRNTWGLLEQLRVLAANSTTTKAETYDVLLAVLKQVKKELCIDNGEAITNNQQRA